MALLQSRIRATVDNPATDYAFDPHTALDELLRPLGLDAKDTGGEISFLGADPIVPSPLRLGGAAALALVAKSVAVAAVHRDRGGPGQDIVADLRSAPHRLCPFYDRRWELLNGYPPASPVNVSPAFGFNQTPDGRWVMPLNSYPKLRVAAQKLLGVPDDPAALAAAIARWDAADLEEAGSAAGVVMPLVRSPREWLATAQHAVLDDTAPVTVRHIGDAPRGSCRPEWTTS